MHAHNLTEVALVVAFALIGGLALLRVKQPPIIGYILAGVILGPSCFGLVTDRDSVSALAELGVLMLLFSIGMELNLRVFKKIWLLAVSAVALQLGLSCGVFYLCHHLLGLALAPTLLFACIFALSSTAVSVKMLQSIGELNTTSGKIILSILIGQDLALIPIIILLRSVESDISMVAFWSKMIGCVGILGMLLYAFGRSKRINFPIMSFLTAGDGSLLPLASLAWCFGCASIAGLVGLSAAYGAFLAGLIIGNTRGRGEMLHVVDPIQSILLMVFFLSVGLLLDLRYVWDHMLMIFASLAVLTVGKTTLNTLILRFLQQPWPRAVLGGLVLSQIGEFSFVLASVGLDSKIIDADGQKLIIALTVLSLFLSPFWVEAARRLHAVAPEPFTGLQQLVDTLYGKEWQRLCQLWFWVKRHTVRLAQMVMRRK
jgi:CPA2 family monovalent cation:H+ antiporter-2